MQSLDIRPSATQYDAIQLAGGLDLLTPTSRTKPGVVRDALNWECSITGGYTRSGGYERYDGRARPSAAQYATLTVTPGAPALVVGAIITGVTSGATGKVLDIEQPAAVVAYTQGTGTFQAGEALQVGGAAAGTVTDLGGAGAAASYDARMRSLAANVYRALVAAVPGSGPVRGVAYLRGTLYAWRDNAGGTALAIHKATSGGWSAIALGGVTLAPGGRVQTDIGNFDGHPRLYGCDGVNPGFAFDGLTLTQIPTGNMPDVPTQALVHKDMLWFAFGAQVQNSAIADPFDWTALGGSQAFRMNSAVTVLARQPGSQAGGVMSVSTLTETDMVYGTSTADLQKVQFEESAGARPYTAQHVGGQTILFGDTGLFSIAATQSFGNFAPSTLTMNIRPWTQARRARCTASLVSREKSQYRAFFADGSALYTTIVNGKLAGSMPQLLPNPATCACQGESVDGSETAFFGAENGFVYQLDAGTSHDGLPIQSYFTLVYAGQGNTRVLKRYRGATLEVQGDSYAEFAVTYDMNYGAVDRPQGDMPVWSMVPLSSSYWDSGGQWDTNLVWDGRTLAPASIRLEGSGENIALRIDCTSALFLPFTMNSIVLHYSARKAHKA